MTRPTSPLTAAACVTAIRETGSLPLAALQLGISQSQIRYRLYRENINPQTLETFPSLIHGPAPSPKQERATIQRALEIGVWHIDENGDIQTYRAGDPYRGNSPNLFDSLPRMRT